MTGMYYIDVLPKELGDKIVRNVKRSVSYEDYLSVFECYYPSFSCFIIGAFSWANTPEGHEYWRNIFKTPLEELCGGFYIKRWSNNFVFN